MPRTSRRSASFVPPPDGGLSIHCIEHYYLSPSSSSRLRIVALETPRVWAISLWLSYNSTIPIIGKGLYILLIEAQGEITVGKLGRFGFDGRYLYVGSTRGPGGFKRVERHLSIASASGKRARKRKRRWHIDYLLEAGRLLQVWLLPDPEFTECELVQRLIARGFRPAVPGFGASDSPCETHLLRAEGSIDQHPASAGETSISEIASGVVRHRGLSLPD